MKDKELEQLPEAFYSVDVPLPEGLAERLEKSIDRMASREKKSKFRRMVYTVGSAAAAILLSVVIFANLQPSRPVLTDTFTDPAEAAVAAAAALTFVSESWNAGIEQVSKAQQEMIKVNEAINHTQKIIKL